MVAYATPGWRGSIGSPVPIGRTVNVPVSGRPRAMLVQPAWIRAIGAPGAWVLSIRAAHRTASREADGMGIAAGRPGAPMNLTFSPRVHCLPDSPCGLHVGEAMPEGVR
jgi:hypothetical protein